MSGALVLIGDVRKKSYDGGRPPCTPCPPLWETLFPTPFKTLDKRFVSCGDGEVITIES